MWTLLDHVYSRADHGGGLTRAQVLLLEQHTGHAILLRHPAELARERVVQMLGGDFRLRRRVMSLQRAGFSNAARRAEMLGSTPPVTQPRQAHRARNCKSPVEWIRAGDVGRARAMQLQERFLKAV